MRHNDSSFSSVITKTTFVLAGLVAGLTLLPIGASATVLNPAYMQAYCPVDETPLSPDNHTCFTTGSGPDPLSITADADLTSLSATVSASGNLTFGAFFSDFARVVYEMEVVFSGNLALINYNVPVLVTASGAAAASGSNSAGASVTVSGLFGAFACTPGFGCFAGTSFGGTQTVYASPGVYQVVVSASATIYPGLGTANAFADPFFEIDPIFLAANPGYSLAFSSNIINGVPPVIPPTTPPVTPPVSVPEPATLSSFLLGITGLVFSRRSKSRSKSRRKTCGAGPEGSAPR